MFPHGGTGVCETSLTLGWEFGIPGLNGESWGKRGADRKHESGIGNLRSNFGSTTELCDLMQGTCSPPELTHKMSELSQAAPKFSF